MFIVEFKTPLSGLCKTLCNLSSFTVLSYVSRQKEKKKVYYVSSLKAVIKTGLVLRELWNYEMKDDIHVANVISPATARNRSLHSVAGIDPVREKSAHDSNPIWFLFLTIIWTKTKVKESINYQFSRYQSLKPNCVLLYFFFKLHRWSFSLFL